MSVVKQHSPSTTYILQKPAQVDCHSQIERPSGHDLISSDEPKRRNDSKPGRVDSFAANGVDIVDCNTEIDFRKKEW